MSVSAGCNCHSAIVKGAGLVDPGGGGGGDVFIARYCV